LTDPAFAELVRDLGYSEIRYVDCGPWYTKAKYEQPLEHPDAGVEERMGAQWVLNGCSMKRQEKKRKRRRRLNRLTDGGETMTAVTRWPRYYIWLHASDHLIIVLGRRTEGIFQQRKSLQREKIWRIAHLAAATETAPFGRYYTSQTLFSLLAERRVEMGRTTWLLPDLPVAMSPLLSWIKSVI
jgi:hypothetical protein